MPRKMIDAAVAKGLFDLQVPKTADCLQRISTYDRESLLALRQCSVLHLRNLKRANLLGRLPKAVAALGGLLSGLKIASELFGWTLQSAGEGFELSVVVFIGVVYSAVLYWFLGPAMLSMYASVQRVHDLLNVALAGRGIQELSRQEEERD